MLRIFSFLLGFGLMVVGSTYIIMYLNLFTFGYSFIEYISYIFRQIECLFAPLGLTILTLSIYIKGGDKIDKYL